MPVNSICEHLQKIDRIIYKNHKKTAGMQRIAEEFTAYRPEFRFSRNRKRFHASVSENPRYYGPRGAGAIISAVFRRSPARLSRNRLLCSPPLRRPLAVAWLLAEEDGWGIQHIVLSNSGKHYIRWFQKTRTEVSDGITLLHAGNFSWQRTACQSRM